jgi:plasmid stabilization system protein ParE
MSLRLQRSVWFIGDLEHYAAWYNREADWNLAERYLQAVALTLNLIAELPAVGHVTNFHAAELVSLRCIQVRSPFQRHLLFYRYDETTVFAERVIHGSVDLAHRLALPPEATNE